MSIRRPQRSQASVLVPARRFVWWWRHDLAALIPASVRKVFSAAPRHLSIVHFPEGTYELRVEPSFPSTTSRQGRLLLRGDWPAVETLLSLERRRWGPVLTAGLRIFVSNCLIRQKAIPARALERADEILMLDLEQATPFRRQDVYCGWRLQALPFPDTATVQQIIAKRSRIDPALNALANLAIPVVRIEVQDDAGQVLPVNLLGRVPQASLLEIALRRMLAGLALFVLVLASAVVGLTFYRQEQALAMLEAEIAVLKTSAAAIRKKIAETDAAVSQGQQVRRRKIESAAVLQVWEDVSRLLPDTAWLTDLRLEEGSVFLDGFAKSASELIGILAGSRYFKEVAFSAPVMRDPQRAMERFQIRMRLGDYTQARAADLGSQR